MFVSKSKSISRIFFRILGVALCLAAIAVVVLTMRHLKHPNVEYKNLISAINQQIPTERRYATVGEDTTGRMPSINVGSKDYVGILKIPRFDRELPVLSATNDNVTTPVLLYGTAAGGNFVIGGAGNIGIFGDLASLPDGDIIEFTDVRGGVYHYRVLTVETVAKDDESGIRERNEEWDLTLVAPSFSGQQQILLRCKFIPNVSL